LVSIQVFHVLEHHGTGGETLLVDGFHVAETLRRTDREAFQCLAETTVPHEYYDKDQRVRSLGTVLTLHPTTKELFCIRYCTRYNTSSPDHIRYCTRYSTSSPNYQGTLLYQVLY
jgi:alpha-ketoglutarate-dependent taurine dioxygenase